MSEYVEQSAVTVLGLGPMGRALAGAFLDARVRTTVWNRTPGRDGELTARGAVGAAAPEEAVAAAGLTVVCVVNQDAVDAIVRRPEVAEALRGRTLLSLTADTPGRAREFAAWAAEHGIRYLDGAIMSPTSSIGTPAAVIGYAGPAELYREFQPVLAALGGTQPHLGEEIGRAAAYDIALLDLFWSAMAGYAHALAIARAEGIAATELLPFAQAIGAILPPIFAEGAAGMESGTFSGEGNPMTSAVSSIEHIVHVSEEHGIDAGLMRAVRGMTRRAVALGHGAEGFLRVAEVLGRG